MMNKRTFTIIIERGEDGYFIGTVPELRGCHSQGKSLDELIENIKEAIQLCLEVEGEPEETLELVGIQKVEV
uniref:Type II toxin-antitoxin system HicB family antitoxin n=1 Tax=candidate division WOR-3 bacterium TaxID=2052148 RepID=A0A7C4XA59_UNCW3